MTIAARSRQLTSEQRSTWRGFVVSTRLLLDELDRALNAESGISMADFGLLARLHEAGEDGLRMSDLADLAVFSRSRISHAVDRLEKEGWVERRSCPTDRRGSYAALTDAGRIKLEQAHPIHDETIHTHLLSRLSPEQVKDLDGITERIRASFGDPDASC